MFTSQLMGDSSPILTVLSYETETSLVSVSDNKTVKIRDTHTGTLIKMLRGHAELLYNAIILPDNVHVISVNYNDTLMVWGWQKGEALLTDSAITRDHGRFKSLFPYTRTSESFPLGFISIHTESDNSQERTVCCWPK
jgi:WD40 repeat protein